MVNRRTTGGYYLTVFNHSGVVRNQAEGEYTLPEAEQTVTITFKQEAAPLVLEGNGILTREDGAYYLTVPAGGFAFIRF